MFNKQNLFAFGIFAVVLGGNSLVFILIYLVCALCCIEYKGINSSLRNNKALILLILAMFIIGIWHYMEAVHPKQNDLLVWSASLIFWILPFTFNHKERYLDAVARMMLLVLILDLGTNLLMVSGIDVPWAKMPYIRSDEILPRYPGVKNNALYSGFIASISLIYVLYGREIGKRWRIFWITLCVIDLFLSGNYRFAAILIFIYTISLTPIYRKPWLFKTSFIVFLILIVLMTVFTAKFSTSNSWRLLLWQHSLDRVLSVDMFGTGFHVPDLPENFSFSTLRKSGVTESTFLSIGICFGIWIMIFMVYESMRVFNFIKKYKKFNPVIAYFLLELSLLFFGGGIGNVVEATLFSLTVAIIKENDNRPRRPVVQKRRPAKKRS